MKYGVPERSYDPGDDSDDDSDEDDDIDDSGDGWEDELGSRVFPEENERESTTGDEEHFSEAEYWTEDEDDDLEEVRESYYGFARTPERAHLARPLARVSQDSAPENAEAPLGPSEEQQHEEGERAPASGVIFSCPLCLEAPKETSATRCGHLFCTP